MSQASSTNVVKKMKAMMLPQFGGDAGKFSFGSQEQA